MRWTRKIGVLVCTLCTLGSLGGGFAAEDRRTWLKLANDGVHDPKSPAVKQLQEPGDALSKLPQDLPGNQVRWMEALEKGYIDPRSNLLPDTKVNILEFNNDIILNTGGGMPMVRFPHRQHSLWLDCANCHEHLFRSKAGATRISMLKILEGEQCGVCHGAVAFPLTECARCHSVPHSNQKPGEFPVNPWTGAPIQAR